jgi:hypothetical protein
MTLLKKELNVKDIKIIKTKTLNNNIRISYDTRLTKQLKLEGEIREVVRQIQDMRKKLGKKPEDKVNLVIPDKFKPLVSDIKNRLMVRKISFGKVLAVK